MRDENDSEANDGNRDAKRVARQLATTSPPRGSTTTKSTSLADGSPWRERDSQDLQVFTSPSNALEKSDHQLLILLAQCRDEIKAVKQAVNKYNARNNVSPDNSANTTPEDGPLSSADTGSPSPDLNDDANLLGTIGNTDSMAAGANRADYCDEILCLVAELKRLQLAIESAATGGFGCMKLSVDKANNVQTELSHRSSQLAASVPTECVLDGSAECMELLVEGSGRLQVQSTKTQDRGIEQNHHSKEKQLKESLGLTPRPLRASSKIPMDETDQQPQPPPLATMKNKETSAPAKRIQIAPSLIGLAEQIGNLNFQIDQQWKNYAILDNSLVEMKASFQTIRDGVDQIECQGTSACYAGAEDVKTLPDRIHQRLKTAVSALQRRLSCIESRQNSNSVASRTVPFHGMTPLESLTQVDHLHDDLTDCSTGSGSKDQRLRVFQDC